MINAVLHLVTNRVGDFHHPSLASAVNYQPHEESVDEASLRNFLGLKDKSTDYYIVGALNSIYSFPEILTEFNETQRTYDLSLWAPDQDVMFGGEFVNSRNDAFNIHRQAQEFPVVFDWVLSYLDSQTLLVQIGTKRYNVPCRVAESVLYAEWPDELGLQGAIRLGDTWQAGFKMNLFHTPIGFPFEAVNQQLENRADARRILTDRGYMPYYYAAQSDIEKYALTLTALAWPENYARRN